MGFLMTFVAWLIMEDRLEDWDHQHTSTLRYRTDTRIFRFHFLFFQDVLESVFNVKIVNDNEDILAVKK